MTEAAKRQYLLKDPVQLGNLAAARVEAQHDAAAAHFKHAGGC